jgi:hypothetical protein
MSNSTANALRAIVKQVVQAADLLDALGTIDQATGEALDRKKRAEAAAAAAEAGLGAAKDALAGQEKLNLDLVQQGKDKAAAIVGEAADARAAADAYVIDQRRIGDSELAAKREILASANARLDAVLDRIAKSEESLAAVNKKLDAARAAFKAALAD